MKYLLEDIAALWYRKWPQVGRKERGEGRFMYWGDSLQPGLGSSRVVCTAESLLGRGNWFGRNQTRWTNYSLMSRVSKKRSHGDGRASILIKRSNVFCCFEENNFLSSLRGNVGESWASSLFWELFLDIFYNIFFGLSHRILRSSWLPKFARFRQAFKPNWNMFHLSVY